MKSVKNQNYLVKITPLGGLGHIGGNMMIYETQRDLMVVDCGVLFANETQPGVDCLIPDISYLLERKSKMRGYVITHGHEDHIGALPHVLGQLPAPIYATPFTCLLLANKQGDYPQLDWQIIPIYAKQPFKVGEFNIEPIHVTHSIPDNVALAIRSPAGIIMHSGDFRFDPTPYLGEPSDKASLKAYGDEGVSLLISDSTNALQPGHSMSEQKVAEELKNCFAKCSGRIVITTFASHIERMLMACHHAKALGRKVAFLGRSMHRNSEAARQHGYLPVAARDILPIEQVADYPADKLVLIVSGSQGEAMSAMRRLARGRSPHAAVEPGDLVIFSSRRIPGHERAIGDMINEFVGLGADVIDEQAAAVHTSGHAYQQEQLEMLALCRPRFFLPVHGELRHLQAHARLALRHGITPSNIILLEDGEPIVLEGPANHPEQLRWRQVEPVPAGLTLVNGTGLGENLQHHLAQALLDERLNLSKGGIVLAAVALNPHGQGLAAKPVVASRGVVLKANGGELAVEISDHIVQHWSKQKNHKPQDEHEQLKQMVYRFLRERCVRVPMVVPLVLPLDS